MKQTIPDLIIITGVMLLLCAVPVGLVFAFQKPAGVQPNADWEFITGIVLSTTIGIIGGLLLCIGEVIVGRRWKRDKMLPK